jgi:hypothetical protein
MKVIGIVFFVLSIILLAVVNVLLLGMYMDVRRVFGQTDDMAVRFGVCFGLANMSLVFSLLSLGGLLAQRWRRGSQAG